MKDEEAKDRRFAVLNIPPRKNGKMSEPFAVGPFDSAVDALNHVSGWGETQILKNPVFPPEYHVIFPQPLEKQLPC
jgi:hypothetical protein